MARLNLAFLDTFEVTLDSHPITRFRSSRNRGLLVYLAMQSDRPFPREVLATLFWPEEQESIARSNLRQAVYQLRKVLGDLKHPDDPYLLVTRQSVQFNPDSDFTLDVNRFWQSITSGDLEAAAAIYHGDLLPGFICDSLPFEDWLRHERERLHQVALETMFEVAKGHLQTGRLDKAQAVARQQIGLEPWRELAYRQLMQAYALDGDRVNALAQYEQCREVLSEELGIEPAAETVALYESIKAGDYGPIAADKSLEASIEVRHNLPVYATLLIGREPEIATLESFIQDPGIRLVTIVGPGGIGKTRLAVATAERIVTSGIFSAGQFFIDLAPLKEKSRILPTLAETLNFSQMGGDDAESKQQLLNFLRPKKMLLVFDNFEHLLDGAELVSEILQAAPGVMILATSRERLNLRPEQVYPIDGLTYADVKTAGDVTEYTAVQLFLHAAQRNQPDFALLKDEDLTYLSRICQLTAGMPLAIELAASWVDMLTLEEIASELQQGLDLLETEKRDMPERHRSVRASFDYTWRRLDETEQAVFTQLSIFRGGFTRAAVQEVTGASLRQLSNLVNKSLIRFDKRRGRYELHELLRQYSAEKLAQQPQLETSIYDRHSTYYLQMLAGFTDALKGKGKAQALSAIEADLENVRQAWDHACVQQNIKAISDSLEALWRFHWDTGRRKFDEFEQAVTEFRKGEAVGARGIVLGRLLAPLGRAYISRGYTANARELLEESLELLQRLGTKEDSLIPLLFLAEVQDSMTESNRLYREGLALARAVSDPWAIGHALLFLLGNARIEGDYQEGRQFGQKALEQFRQNGDDGGIAATLAELSRLAIDMGRYADALAYAQESITVAQGTSMMGVMGLYPMGQALYGMGEYGKAEEQVRQVLVVSREFGREDQKIGGFFLLGEIAFRRREYARASQLYKDSLETAVEYGDLQMVIRNHISLGSLYVAQGRVGEAREHLHTALQKAIQLNQRPSLLDCLAPIAELFMEEGDLDYAALLAMLLTADPATRAMSKERGTQLLARIEKDLSANEMDAVRKQSRSYDLNALADQLLVKLETPQ